MSELRKLVFLGALFLAVFISPGLSFASHPGEDDEINSLTTQLLQTAGFYHRAPAAQKTAALDKLVDLAAQRKGLLLAELKTDPEGFLLHALPADVRRRIPGKAQGFLEEHVADLEGEFLAARGDDFDRHRTDTFYGLTADDGTVYRLYFVQEPQGVQHGSRVRIKNGVRLGLELAVAARQGNTSGMETTTAVAATVSGEKKTITLVGNFLDKNTPYSTTTIDGTMYTNSNSVANLYQEASFNQVTFTGSTYGPFTIPYNSTSTNFSGWTLAMDQAARDAGVLVDDYPHRVYVLPTNGSGYAGYSTIGGNPSRSAVYYNYPDIFVHETGHGIMSFHHASTSTGSEYGDNSCPMGYGNVGLRHFNAPHKVGGGWLPSSRVQTVTASGTYTIGLLEQTDGVTVQALKIAKPDTQEYYYLSYRRAVGFGNQLPTAYRDQTSVHRWNGLTGSRTYFYDALADGEVWSDAANGITEVKQISHDLNRAAVSVTITAPACVPANPTVTVSPTSRSGSPGGALSYTVSVKNNDSSSCPAATFSLGGLVPAGWSSSFSPASIQLAPGAIGQTTWTVTSAATAPEGSYTITAQATDVAGANHAASQNATSIIVIDNPPSVSITSPTDGKVLSGRVKVSVSASDDFGVNQVEFYVDGAKRYTDTSAPYEYTWNTRKVANGSHTLSAKAVDTLGQSTTSAAVSVTVSN